jgi:hypothetical protein
VKYDWAIIEAIALGLLIAELITLRLSRRRDREAEMARRQGTNMSNLR